MSTKNLYGASYQWMTRPSDERFATVKEMHDFCTNVRVKSTTEYFPSDKLRVYDDGGEIMTMLKDRPVKFSNFGFGQLCERVSAPAQYMRRLPSQLVVDNINYGLEQALQAGFLAAQRKGQQEAESKDINALLYRPNGDGEIICRSMLTKMYKRIWNSDVTERLGNLLHKGWRVPPARPAFENQPGARRATLDDVLNDKAFSLSIQVGDLIAPAGLYASDHDVFGFMVDPNRSISDGVSKEPLFRGFFVSNTEVGDGSFALTTFLYRHVCGNHIVWGASKVRTLRIRHTGAAQFSFGDRMMKAVAEYDDSAASKEEEMIRKAVNMVLGKTRDEVVQTLLDNAKVRKMGLGKRVLEAAYDDTSMHAEDGNPNTLYAMINGATRWSQITPYADERTKLDEAAGKLMELVS